MKTTNVEEKVEKSKTGHLACISWALDWPLAFSCSLWLNPKSLVIQNQHVPSEHPPASGVIHLFGFKLSLWGFLFILDYLSHAFKLPFLYFIRCLQYFKEFYRLFHYIVRIRNYCSLFKNSYPLIMDNKLIGNNATNSIQANASL